MFGRARRMTLKELASPLPRVEEAVPAWITNDERPLMLYRFAVWPV